MTGVISFLLGALFVAGLLRFTSFITRKYRYRGDDWRD